MSDERVLQALRDVHFLRDLAEEHLEPLASVGRYVEFPGGTVLFREGEPAARTFIVVEGSVSLEICAPGVGCRRILTVNAGDLLGWSPVLEQGRLTATARTITPTRAIELNGPQILTLCEHNPRFGYEFMRRVALALSKRLNATRLQLMDVYGAQMPVMPDASQG